MVVIYLILKTAPIHSLKKDGLKLPAYRARLPGKEDACFLLRPLSPPIRRGLRVALPVIFIFAVQESNPTKGVTLTEIEDIYAGKSKTWPDGTPIRLILRPLRDSFSVYLASINPRFKSASEKAHSIPGVFVGTTDQEAAEQIEKTPGSFGTTSSSLMAVEKRRIKALSFDGAAPVLSNIADGVHVSAGNKYPFTMTMSLVYKGDTDKGAVKDFIKFVSRSMDGSSSLKAAM